MGDVGRLVTRQDTRVRKDNAVNANNYQDLLCAAAAADFRGDTLATQWCCERAVGPGCRKSSERGANNAN